MPTKWLDALWLKMSAIYPAWNNIVGLHPYVLDDQGEPTTELSAKGAVWSQELANLTGEQIKQGLANLKNRSEKSFPPTVFEFVELCTGNDYEDVLDAIMCRLQEGESYKFTNQLAFNFWQRYSFDLNTGNYYNVPKLIKQNLDYIDKSSMFPLPDYSVKSLEQKKPVQKAVRYNRKKRKAFQSHMFACIAINKPLDYDKKKIDKAFSAPGTCDLIDKFKEQGLEMPTRPAKQAWQAGKEKTNKLVHKTKLDKYTQAIKTVFYNFCQQEGLLS